MRKEVRFILKTIITIFIIMILLGNISNVIGFEYSGTQEPKVYFESKKTDTIEENKFDLGFEVNESIRKTLLKLQIACVLIGGILFIRGVIWALEKQQIIIARPYLITAFALLFIVFSIDIILLYFQK